MNHVFIGVPKNDTGMDTPRSVIFGTRKADEDNFRLINITCQNNHLTFENVAQTPEMRWSADISGEDIGKEYDFSFGIMVDATKVEDFISNKESSKLKCPELVTDGKSYKSTPLTTAMFFLLLSQFKFNKKNPVFGRTFHRLEALATAETWYLMTMYLDSKVTEDLVRKGLKEESKAWILDFKVDFQDETNTQPIFTTKNAILGGTALASAGLGVGAAVHREKLQRLFNSRNLDTMTTRPNKRTQQGGMEGAHGSKSLQKLLKDYKRLNIRQACVEGRVDPTNVSVWANRSGIWNQVDISELWGRRLKQSLCRELAVNMLGLSRAQYEAMLHNGDLITVYRHKNRDHYAILLRLRVKTP